MRNGNFEAQFNVVDQEMLLRYENVAAVMKGKSAMQGKIPVMAHFH